MVWCGRLFESAKGRLGERAIGREGLSASFFSGEAEIQDSLRAKPEETDPLAATH